MTVRVLIADRHPVIREGLARLLSEARDVHVVGMAETDSEVVRQATHTRCHVLVIDLAVAGLSGIDVARRLRILRPVPRILVFSSSGTSQSVQFALQAGAYGYVLRTAPISELMHAIRAVAEGRRYASRDLPKSQHKDFLAGRARRTPLERLSERERQVLRLVVDGGTSATIALKLSLSPKTVETYRSRAMRKLAVRGIPELVKFCIGHGIAPL